MSGKELDTPRPSGSSEVVILDERAIAAAVSRPPPKNVNIHKSKNVIVGTKIEFVTNRTEQVVKGRFPGLRLVTKKRVRKLRSSIAIFVCWAFVIAIVLTIFLVHYINLYPQRLDIGLNESWYLRRDDWQAMDPYSNEALRRPVKNVIIGHSAGIKCTEKFKCIADVLNMQMDHIQLGWDDIGPNFLVGSGGLVFEGRGANYVGAMVQSWNRNSISIMFLGDYNKAESEQIQFDHTNILIDVLVKQSVVSPNYVVVGHCQIPADIVSPGQSVMDGMGNFTHWIKGNCRETVVGKGRGLDP